MSQNFVTLDEVRDVRTPSRTDSWVPIPHIRLYERIRSSIEGRGLKVVEEQHGLDHDGARWFGTLDLVNGNQHDDYRLCVGMRNSHDKVFPAGIAVGARVFVCDNLSFSGEIVIARKHTRFINRDLPGLIAQAIGRMVEVRESQERRIEAYKGTRFNDAKAHDLIIRAMDARVISSTYIPHIVSEWREPRHKEFKRRNVWSLFNAFTEHLKEVNRNDLVKRTVALHGLCDQACGLAVA